MPWPAWAFVYLTLQPHVTLLDLRLMYDLWRFANYFSLGHSAHFELASRATPSSKRNAQFWTSPKYFCLNHPEPYFLPIKTKRNPLEEPFDRLSLSSNQIDSQNHDPSYTWHL